jgi:hypothetical protein
MPAIPQLLLDQLESDAREAYLEQELDTDTAIAYSHAITAQGIAIDLNMLAEAAQEIARHLGGIERLIGELRDAVAATADR